LLLGYKPVQQVTVLNIVGNCNTVVLLYYIILYHGTTVLYAVRRPKRRYATHTCMPQNRVVTCALLSRRVIRHVPWLHPSLDIKLFAKL